MLGVRWTHLDPESREQVTGTATVSATVSVTYQPTRTPSDVKSFGARAASGLKSTSDLQNTYCTCTLLGFLFTSALRGSG